MNGLAAAQAAYDRMVPEYENDSDEAIALAVDELVKSGSEYDPFDSENLAEALSEQEPEFFIAVAKALREGQMAAVAHAVLCATDDYWRKVAEYKAEQDVESTRCSCGKFSCARCADV